MENTYFLRTCFAVMTHIFRSTHIVIQIYFWTIKGSTNSVQMHHLHLYIHTNEDEKCEDEKFRPWTEEVLLVSFALAGNVSAYPVSVDISTSRSTREKVYFCLLREPVHFQQEIMFHQLIYFSGCNN